MLFLDAVTDSVTGEGCDGRVVLEDSLLEMLSKLPEVPKREDVKLKTTEQVCAF